MATRAGSVKEMQKRVLFLVQIAISFGLFYVIFNEINLNQINNVISDIDVWLFVAALMVKFSSVLISAALLSIVVEILSGFVPFWEIARIYFSSFFYNSIGIGTIGGDMYRWYKLRKVTNSKEISSLIIITEKVIVFSVLVSLVVVGLIVALLGGSYFMLLLLVPMPFVLLYAVVQAMRVVMRVLGRVKIISQMYPFEMFEEEVGKVVFMPPKMLLKSVGLALVFYAANIAAFALIVYSVDQSVPLSASILILPVVIFFTSLPISFQGFGLREVTVAYLFVAMGYPAVTGAVVAMAYLMANLVMAGASGLFTVSRKIKFSGGGLS